VFAGVGAGIVFAGALCIALMTLGAGSRMAWLLLGVAGFLVTATVWPVVKEAGSATKVPFTRYRWTPDALRLVACYAAFGIGYIIPATFVPVMAKAVIQNPAIFGWAWPVFGAAAVASTLMAGAFARRLNGRRLWMASTCVMALGVASALFVQGLTGIIGCALLVGGTFVVATLAGVQVAREVAGGGAYVLLAAMTASFAASQVAGPLIVSFLAERSLGFDAALVKVTEKMKGPLTEEFKRASGEQRVGKSRQEALRGINERVEVKELQNFISAIIQADQLGVSMSKVLRIQSEQLRQDRRQRAEEKAARAPILIMLPTVGCIFPSLFIVILAPAALSALSSCGSF